MCDMLPPSAAASSAAVTANWRHAGGTSTRRGTSPSRRACRSTSFSLPRESQSAHRFACVVMRSAASFTEFAAIHADRAAISACSTGRLGVSFRIAPIAFVLSVKL